MRRTNILRAILSLLLVALFVLIFYKNYDKLQIDNIIDIFKGKKVVIPDKCYNQLNYNFLTIKPTDNFVPNNIDDIKRIYYTVLNNGWKEFTFYCPKEYTNCTDDVVSFTNNSQEISLLNNYVNPYNSYKKFDTLIIDNSEIYITVEKLYSNDEIEYVDNKIDKIINELKIDKNDIKITDIKNIHNYLIKNISYDEEYTDEDTDTISNKAYGALSNKVALCSGYSDTFSIFLNKLNIPNFKVSSEDHIWNVIYFDNKWSHIDVTWDDDEINPNNTYNFFMVNTKKLLENDSEKHNFNQDIYLELK